MPALMPSTWIDLHAHLDRLTDPDLAAAIEEVYYVRRVRNKLLASNIGKGYLLS